MATRRRKLVIDDVVDSAVDALFDRGAELIDRMRQPQPAVAAVPSLPADAMRTCAACRRKFRVKDMEMINPRNTFGLCPRCFGFMWDAAKKVMATANQPSQTPPQPQRPPSPPRRPPWEVLGVDANASIEDVKRAYRKLAAQYHPDTVPPGATTHEKEQVTAQFMEVQRAYEVMMKVRKAPE